MELDKLLLLLDGLRNEALYEVLNPPEENKTEFGYGRISGVLFTVERLRELVNDDLEEKSRRQEEFERDN